MGIIKKQFVIAMSLLTGLFGGKLIGFASQEEFEIKEELSCGMSGTVEERIKDCQELFYDEKNSRPGQLQRKRGTKYQTFFADRTQQSGGRDYHWKLVSMTTAMVPTKQVLENRKPTGPRFEFTAQAWLDEQTGLIWSDRSLDRLTHSNAVDFCANTDETLFLKGFLDAEFRLPSIEEFKTAETHGFKTVLPARQAKLGEVIRSDGSMSYAIRAGWGFWTNRLDGNNHAISYDPDPFPIFGSSERSDRTNRPLRAICVMET